MKPGTDKLLQHELARARKKCGKDAAHHYWLGVIDGLVFAMSALGISTKPKK